MADDRNPSRIEETEEIVSAADEDVTASDDVDDDDEFEDSEDVDEDTKK